MGSESSSIIEIWYKIGNWDVTGVYHEDIDDVGEAVTSIAIPLPKTRRVTLHAARKFGDFIFEAGGIWGGQPLNGREFQIAEGTTDNYIIYTDEINEKDNWGAKAKLTYQKGAFKWYAQGASMGLVANGGSDQTQTFTGWKLKDSGSGNQNNFLLGLHTRLEIFKSLLTFYGKSQLLVLCQMI